MTATPHLHPFLLDTIHLLFIHYPFPTLVPHQPQQQPRKNRRENLPQPMTCSFILFLLLISNLHSLNFIFPVSPDPQMTSPHLPQRHSQSPNRYINPPSITSTPHRSMKRLYRWPMRWPACGEDLTPTLSFALSVSSKPRLRRRKT